MHLDKAPVGLRYFAPARPLRDVISSYYIFHANLPHCADSMRADLPQLRFMVSGAATYRMRDGQVVAAPDVTLMGPTFGSSHFDGVGPMLTFGIGFMPAGWAALIRDDASLFADQVVDAVPMLGSILTEALDAMRNEHSHAAMVAIANFVMLTLFATANEPPVWFTQLASQWLASSASPQVDDIVESSGLSSRQVERLANRIYGGSPKMLARKYRALKAASELIENGGTWQEVVGEAFFDQSHFIREIKQFIGVTPRQLLTSPSPLTRLTFQRRKLVDTLPALTLIT